MNAKAPSIAEWNVREIFFEKVRFFKATSSSYWMRFNEKTCADSQQSRELKPTRCPCSLPNASVGIFICPNIIFRDFTSVCLLYCKHILVGIEWVLTRNVRQRAKKICVIWFAMSNRTKFGCHNIFVTILFHGKFIRLWNLPCSI